MLVRSFKIEVCRPSEDVLVRTAHDRIVGRAGIEPYVENVGRLHVVLGVFADQLFGFGFRPGLNAAFGNERFDLLHDFKRIGVQMSRFLVKEEGQRHTPVALARDAPVGTILNH